MNLPPRKHRRFNTKPNEKLAAIRWSLATLEPRLLLAADVAAPVVAESSSVPMVTTTAEATAADTPQSIVFVDPRAIEVLRANHALVAGAELVLLDGNRSGIDQISAYLAQRQSVAAIHIVSHGQAGSLQLGNTTFDIDAAIANAQQLKAWRSALADNADILLYGCNLAADPRGRALVNQLADLTGADVAASTDPTANVSNGGNWILEYRQGSIETSLVLSEESMQQFTGQLMIQVRAAGTTGDERLRLEVNGQTITTWTLSNTNADAGTFRTFTADIGNATIDQVRLRFINDLYDPAAGIDRNVRVDFVQLNGTTFQTEDPLVFASGVFVEGQGIVSGNLQTEYLHTDGYFQYRQTAPPSVGTLEQGLIAYYKLDETSLGVAIVDSSGNGNQGSSLGIASPQGPSTDLAINSPNNLRSLQFDGVNDYVAINRSDSLQLSSGTYTQSLWLKSTSTDNNFHGVIGYQSGTNVGERYPFIYVKGTSLYAGFGTGGNSWKGVVANNVISVGQWSQVTVTFDGSEMNLFVNGQQVAFNSDFGGSRPTTNTNQLNIGRVNNQFKGFIDEVRMYDRALSEGEVSQLAAGYIGPGNGGGTQTSPGSIGFAATQYTISEADGSVTIRFSRTGGTVGEARVFFQTQDSTAIEGRDYIGNQNGIVIFADGQTTATATIQVNNNNTIDGDRNFQLSMFRVEGAAQGQPRTAIVTITDDESGGGLIGHWRLDDLTANGQIADASGRSNIGTGFNFNKPSGSTTDTPNTASANPGAIRFDGVNDYIDIATSESLRLTSGKYSQSVWIKPTSTDDKFHGILGYQEGSSVGTRYPFIYLRGNSIYAGFGTGSSTWQGVVAENVVTSNAWNHVGVSFDGTNMSVYVNGELVGTNSDFSGALPTTAIARLSIGRINNQFVGSIDDVRMYDRAISGAEVRGLIDNATLPPPRFSGFFTTSVLASGLAEPTALERLADGRFYVAERAGIIRVVNANGTVNSTPLLDIREIVNRVGNDRGLMSIAIPPDFATSRQIYVAYTYDPLEVQGRTGNSGPDGEGGRVARVSRFTVNAAGTVADRNSEVVVLGKNSLFQYIGQPNRRPELSDPKSGVDANGNYINDFIASDELSHTVGNIEFGADGALYVSVGDGGSYGRVDPDNLRALDLNSLNGKILRVDPLTGLGLADNPFFNGNADSNQSRVYNLGLRNPFRFAINPANGELYISDVGWLTWEEINTGRGKNFGWPVFEGNSPTGGSRGSYGSLPEVRDYVATNPTLTGPLWTRSHNDGARAIIIGDFISGGQYPQSLQGAFLFTDIGDQVLRAGRLDANGNLIDVIPVSSQIGFITNVTRAPDGTLFYSDLVAGTIGRLVYNA